MDVPITKYILAVNFIIHCLLIGSSLSSPFINFYSGNWQSNQKKDGKKREASDNNSNERAPRNREDNLS